MAGEAGTDFVPLTPAPSASPPAAPPPPAAPGTPPTGSAAPPAGGATGGGVAPATTTQTQVQPQQAYTLPPEYLAQFQAKEQEAERWRRQAQQFEPMAAQWQRSQYEQQQKAAAEQQKAQANIFGVQYDANLRSWVRLNEQSGQYEAIQGAPPGAVDAFVRQERAMGDAARNFFANPDQYLNKYVGAQAQQIAEKMVQQHLAQYQDANHSNEFLRSNSDWMMEGGRFQTGFDGKPMGKLSPEGQLFAQHVQQLTQAGMTNGRAIAEQAKKNTYFHLMMRERQRGQQPGQPQLAAGAPPVDTQAAFLATAGGVIPSTPVVPASPPPPPYPADASLDEIMRQAFRQAGVTDADIVTH